MEHLTIEQFNYLMALLGIGFGLIVVLIMVWAMT